MVNREFDPSSEPNIGSGGLSDSSLDLMRQRDWTKVTDQTSVSDGFQLTEKAISSTLGWNIDPNAKNVHIDRTAFLTPKIGNHSLATRIDGLKT